MSKTIINYNQYLQSNTWKTTRELFIDKQCYLCKSIKNLHLHHKSYQNIGNELPDDLITLCSACHKAIHFSSSGRIKRWQSGSELYIKAVDTKRLNWKYKQKLQRFRDRVAQNKEL